MSHKHIARLRTVLTKALDHGGALAGNDEQIIRDLLFRAEAYSHAGNAIAAYAMATASRHILNDYAFPGDEKIPF